MGLTPPAGAVDQACRRALPRPPSCGAREHVTIFAARASRRLEKMLPFAWCCKQFYDLKMSHIAPMTIHNYASHNPTTFFDRARF